MTDKATDDSHREIMLIHGRRMSVKLCDHLDRGQRCANIAVFSPNTHGGGPWYCRQHDGTYRGSARTPIPGGFQVMRDLVAASRQRQPGEEG